jgi:inhibitor of KinA
MVHIGDSCVAVQFGAALDPTVNATCIAVAASLTRQALPGVRDVVPTYNAVTVHFQPLLTDRAALYSALESARGDDVDMTDIDAPTIEIPVSYGGEAGPDLSAVADFAGCSEREVIQRHAAVVYRVYMLGFLPGFAYMGAVDDRIAMPRFDTPRMRVVAGSVGIAAQQTGIYPFDSPGGWRIIGRTPMKPFDASRPQPFLLKAGDHVKFVAG